MHTLLTSVTSNQFLKPKLFVPATITDVPDNSSPLLVADPLIICEEDGVVGHHGVTRGEDAWHHMAHHVQNAIVHQQIIH